VNGEAVKVEREEGEQQEESGRGRTSPPKEVRGRSPQKEINNSLSPSKSESSIVSASLWFYHVGRQYRSFVGVAEFEITSAS
jgi:hypothetical protein